MISKIDARNGACGFIPHDLDGAIVTNDFPVYEIDGAADSRYLDHLVDLPVFWRLCESASDGTTNRVRLDLGLFDDLEFPMPPLHEQRAIAAVLDAIDEAIERTEAVISDSERLRDALLHELLTRGVSGWHTEWRTVPGLGTIPANWQVMPLGDFATLQRGVDLPVQDRAPGSIPVYGSNGVLGDHSEALRAGPGVITGRSGSIGVVYYSSGPYWPLNTTLYVRDLHGNNAKFAYYLLTRFRLEKFAASTGVPSLNRNFVHPIPVAVPSRCEQMEIASILSFIDETLNIQRAEIDTVRLMKDSLSSELLTGKRRFTSRMKSTVL